MKRFEDLTPEQKVAAEEIFLETTVGLAASGTVVPDEVWNVRERVLNEGGGLTGVKAALAAEPFMRELARQNAHDAYYPETSADSVMHLYFVDARVALKRTLSPKGLYVK